MADRVNVIEDGVTTEPQRRRRISPWVLGLAGFVVGLGLGVLAVGPSPAETEPTTPLTTPSVEPPAVSDGDTGVPAGIGEVIPGFPDALVVVADTPTGALERILWPIESAMQTSAIAGGAVVSLDASSEHLALSTEIPDQVGAILSRGRFNSIEAIASGVTSYGWHDSTSGWLGFTVDPVDDEGTTLLHSSKGGISIDTINGLPGPEVHHVAGWGDWGWALQRSDIQVVLLTPDGDFKTTETGTALDTHHSGWVLVVDGPVLKMVSGGGGVRHVTDDPTIGVIARAEFSPDGSLVAIQGPRGHGLLDLSSGEVGWFDNQAVTALSWSSDSRFVLAATDGGLVVDDLATGETYSILDDRRVVEVGVVPLGSP